MSKVFTNRAGLFAFRQLFSFFVCLRVFKKTASISRSNENDERFFYLTFVKVPVKTKSLILFGQAVKSILDFVENNFRRIAANYSCRVTENKNFLVKILTTK